MLFILLNFQINLCLFYIKISISYKKISLVIENYRFYILNFCKTLFDRTIVVNFTQTVIF